MYTHLLSNHGLAGPRQGPFVVRLLFAGQCCSCSAQVDMGQLTCTLVLPCVARIDVVTIIIVVEALLQLRSGGHLLLQCITNNPLPGGMSQFKGRAWGVLASVTEICYEQTSRPIIYSGHLMHSMDTRSSVVCDLDIVMVGLLMHNRG
jgi:hypothetical protein